MKTKLFYLFAGFIVLTFSACETENSPVSSKNTIQSKTNNLDVAPVAELTPCSTTKLIAGQSTEIGAINVYFDAENVYVEYKTSDEWFIKKTHLFVGDFELIPLTRSGNPVIGTFPLSTLFPDQNQSVVYTIAKSSLPECFCISANADVFQTVNSRAFQSESAWGQGTLFTQKGRAMYFSACQSDCNVAEN